MDASGYLSWLLARKVQPVSQTITAAESMDTSG